MAPNDSAHTTEEARDLVAGRRKAARYLVPVGVAGVAAATIGLVPALAASGDPDLPKISAQQLIEKIAASDAQQLSGTVKINTDLGLPSVDGLASLGPKRTGGGGGSSASPDSKLMELASGKHTLRVASDGPDRQKLSVLDKASEYSVIHNGADVWAYDSASNQVYHSKRAADGKKELGGHPGKAPGAVPTTPKAMAEQALKAVDPTTSVTVDGTLHVAGRDAYQLVIKPKQSGSTIGAIRIAVDAKNGVPLKFVLAPAGGGKAVIDAGFTKVDFGKPSASTFDFTAPKGAKVTQDDGKAHGGKAPNGPRGQESKGLNVIGKGWTAVYRLDAPGGKDTAGLVSGKGDMSKVPPEAQKFMNSLGDHVTGKFGSGTVFKTRLINALMTDDGKVYVGAVSKDALVNAANAAK
ncbi:outer membrane lipoprotein carrier protein LolA [Streptomyces sp. cg36]|uniref:LolA family protein n=1 Tax=Streptomyces sp. cg36 TaxID=3238798 RepID=UPI0034E2A65D